MECWAGYKRSACWPFSWVWRPVLLASGSLASLPVSSALSFTSCSTHRWNSLMKGIEPKRTRKGIEPEKTSHQNDHRRFLSAIQRPKFTAVLSVTIVTSHSSHLRHHFLSWPMLLMPKDAAMEARMPHDIHPGQSCFGETEATATKAPFSPLFEAADRQTHRGWCLSSVGPNRGRTSVTRWSLFGHSRRLISSDKPSKQSIDSNHRQHTTQAVSKGLQAFQRKTAWRFREDSNPQPAD